jgi:hypothetical protein
LGTVAIAVLIPIRCPEQSTSAPPELPGFDRRVGLDRPAEIGGLPAVGDGRHHRPRQAQGRAQRDHRLTDDEASEWPRVITGN